MLRNKRTITRHITEDHKVIKAKKTHVGITSPRLSGCSFDPDLYDSHPAAKTSLYKNSEISVLDYIFVEFRKCVSHLSYAKITVSETFRTDSVLKLPKPDHCPKDLSSGKHLITDSLVLIIFHVCSNDCVIFTGEISS